MRSEGAIWRDFGAESSSLLSIIATLWNLFAPLNYNRTFPPDLIRFYSIEPHSNWCDVVRRDCI
jgi:hypothetical protein